jgi:hypothetical protein
MNTQYEPGIRLQYDIHFQSFLMKLTNISHLYPREKYLYSLMDKVIFKDFETAMSSTIIDFADVSNDNQE